MGELRLMVAECNYQELDRQLKEQFIHGLNDKVMLGEIIKELMATRGNNHITSGNVLAWAKGVEAQRAQAAVMNSIIEYKEFDKIKVSRTMCKESPKRPAQYSTSVWQVPTHPGNALHMARHAHSTTKLATSRESVGVRRPGQYTR